MKLVLFLLLFFISQLLIAQDNETALANVHYNFVHVNDTTQRDKNYHDEVVLYLGQHSSYYTSYASKLREKQLRKQIEAPGFDGNLTISSSGSGSPESYYTVPSKHIMKEVYMLMNDHYLLDEEFPVLNWKIGKETKEIGGYSCQKAETRFKGRDYIAWFTTAIPFQAGPWKLQGLPGLILEAADVKNEVAFKYAGFEKLEANDVQVGLPENVMKTDKGALTKLVEAFHKNPMAAYKARSQGGSRSSDPLNKLIDPSQIKSISVVNEGNPTSRVTNNPIELED